MPNMATFSALAVMLMLAYQVEAQGAAPKFQINFPVDGVASCYGKDYSYYKSWSCGSAKCPEGESS